MILPFQTEQASLDTVGGKGYNLARLARGGFPVPPGFLVATDAYRAFVTANKLTDKISARIAALPTNNPEALQAASQEIRAWFTAGDIPPALSERLRQAYVELGGAPVAVRSSATAEDLPDMSFAGQQDTFLNVQGETGLLKAVVDCWSSLWTARAIGYRARNEIPHGGVALAVVVQEMVPAEASGVLFTANPLTGLRSETVIDATLGLGEALVGGHVEPDHYVVDMTGPTIREKTLGAKAIAMESEAGGGIATRRIDAGDRQALPDDQILTLAALGQQIAATYNFPQDIEWAAAGGQLYILQSRPITSLYPIPEGMGPDPLQVLFSFGSVQGILDPMTPLGMDAIRMIFAGGASLFGYRLTHETQGVIKSAGERLWVNITPVVRTKIGRRIATIFASGADPGTVPVLTTIQDEPKMTGTSGRVRLATVRRFLHFYRPVLKNALNSARHPKGRAEKVEQEANAKVEILRAKSELPEGKQASLAHRVAIYREIYNGFPYAVPMMGNAIGGLVPLAILSRFSKHLTGSVDLALSITRGIPHNVTTEMDLVLWETARAIREHPEALAHVEAHEAELLAKEYQAGDLPEVAQQTIQDFLDRYGMRGLGEIDIGRPRWREDPTHIIQVLKSYLKIESADQAPDAVFQRGAVASAAAEQALIEAARRTFGGALKTRVIKATALRVRELSGLRESPKFYMVRMMGIIRAGLLESGQELVDSGVLDRPDDLFYFYLNELDALAAGDTRDWRALATERRANYAREKRRGQVPRLLYSDGRAFYKGVTAPEEEGTALVGSPVSPGVVSGTVRVVLDPIGAQLEPGEILVCPGTDPAWTPLFLSAGGLVMEVGGLMTHGAIVAREYGIPAVVGVDRATTRLQTGQIIQVDGSTGRILIEN